MNAFALLRRMPMTLVPTLLAVLAAAAPAAEGPWTFRSGRAAGAMDRVEIELEVGGNLRVAGKGGDQRGEDTVKMSAVARLNYDEKTLAVPSASDGTLRSVRHYDKAEAVIKVGEDGVKPELRKDRRIIGAEASPPKATLFSPHGPLTRDELDLVDLLGNSLLLDGLLPAEPAKPKDSWALAAPLAAALCGLEEVRRSDVQVTLLEVTDDVARFEMAGKIEGTVTGLATKLDVKAKFRFDRRLNRIDWLGMVVQEDRQRGAVGPGLDVTARLQVKVAPQAKSAALDDAALKDLATAPTEPLRQLSYAAPGGRWQLLHDRRWVVVKERDDRVTLRMADAGAFVAECNVVAHGDKAAPPATELSGFQETVRQLLGKNFRQMVRAGEGRSEAGYRHFSVQAQGVVDDKPMVWFYHLVLDDRDRFALLAFAIPGEMAERFADTDRAVAASLRFGP